MSENTNGTSGGQQKPTLSWSQPAAAKPASNTPVKPVSAPTPTPAPVKTTAPHAAAATHAPQNTNTGTYMGIFVAGLIVGALLGWGISSGKNGGASTTASSTDMMASSTATGSTTGSENTVDLSGSAIGSSGNMTLAATQQAGFAVAVNRIIVTEPTWLVVYEDHAGVPGNAIGAGLFFHGVTSGTIELLRATLPGQSYFVGQSLDDGDKVFSVTADKPVRDAKGNPLFTQFTAQ